MNDLTSINLEPESLACEEIGECLERELTICEAFPNLSPSESTVVLVDCSNLYHRAKAAGFSIDYRKLRSVLASRCKLDRIIAFTAINGDSPDGRNIVFYLRKIGFEVVSRVFHPKTSASNKLDSDTNLDVLITIHALELPTVYDHIILATCDGDFSPVLTKLKQKHGVKVSVIGVDTPLGNGMHASLIRQADNFYNLDDIKKYVSCGKNDGE